MKKYILYNNDGIIQKISSKKISGKRVIETNSEYLDLLEKDLITPDLLFVKNNKLYKKDNLIFFEEPQKRFSKIKQTEHGNISDFTINIDADKNNIEFSINYEAIKKWCLRNLKDYKFYKDYKLIFNIFDKNKKIDKIEFLLSDLDEDLKLTKGIKLPNDLTNIYITTNKIVENYGLFIKNNNNFFVFKKIHKRKILNKYDLVIHIKDDKLIPKNKNHSDDIYFYITEKNINYILKKTFFNEKLDIYNIKEKEFFVNKNINVLLEI